MRHVRAYRGPTLVWAFAIVLSIGIVVAFVKAQSPAAQQCALLFSAADLNKDGFVTRDELETTFSKLLSDADTSKSGSVTQEQLATAVNEALPQPVFGAARLTPAQNQIPRAEDVARMMASLPDSAPARPARPRRVLVLCKANGFVHSSIPLAAKTIDAMGTKTGAWSTRITYDAADINTANLQQYDVIFLDNTTGAFLDDPRDSGTTAARKAALVAFVRGGKGLAGIHAASDSYHSAASTFAPSGVDNHAGGQLVALMVADGDRNNDQHVSAREMSALADAWFDKLDEDKTGKVNQKDFTARLTALIPAAETEPVPQGPDDQVGTWPDYNNLIAGFFKFHWVFPQAITVKIDDPQSPLTAMFHGKEFVIHDETYTMGINSSWSRKNVHVLTSIDYAKMSAEDKAREAYPRADHDYGLSWIRREGQGRVFYEAHGHDESVYAIKPMLEHILAGVQYAIGDLKADDSPSDR